MKVSLDELKEAKATSEPDLAPGEIVNAIIKVKQENYVPPGVHLRARIDPCMFTASFAAGDFSKIESDPNVASVEISKPLNLIK
jgi:hypothetical protein